MEAENENLKEEVTQKRVRLDAVREKVKSLSSALEDVELGIEVT